MRDFLDSYPIEKVIGTSASDSFTWKNIPNVQYRLFLLLSKYCIYYLVCFTNNRLCSLGLVDVVFSRQPRRHRSVVGIYYRGIISASITLNVLIDGVHWGLAVGFSRNPRRHTSVVGMYYRGIVSALGGGFYSRHSSTSVYNYCITYTTVFKAISIGIFCVLEMR